MSKGPQILNNKSQLTGLQTARHKPQQPRAAEKVRIILVAAAQLFAEVGIEKTTTNLVAARAGVPVGSVYKYFKDKRSIVTSVYELYVNELCASIEAIVNDAFMSGVDAGTVLEALRGEWRAFIQANRMDILRHFFYSEPSWNELLQAGDDRVVEAITKVVKRITEADVDHEIVAILIYKMAISYEVMLRTQPDKAERYRVYMNRALLAIL